MVDYQRMYYILCKAASEALDHLPETEENEKTRSILTAALLEAEEIYMAAEE